MHSSPKQFIDNLSQTNPHQPEFIQAVTEVIDDIYPYIQETDPSLFKERILERLTEPERVIQFRVCWTNDAGEVEINRGYRVQMNSSMGPYKGGLRFSPTVNLSILKFLAFEQVLKNSLTGLPLGAGKGGSDFNPRNRSNREIMSFCQNFMTELYRHIGPHTDIPAGDIGVGEREIGYLFGQYKKIKNEYTSVITGKGAGWGGSFIRPEATGYGLLYFVQLMLKNKRQSIEGKTITLSGCGNVAQYAALKAIELGAKAITFSNSDGVLYDKEGFSPEKIEFVQLEKESGSRDFANYTKQFNAEFIAGRKPWSFPCDISLPCATENEMNAKDVQELLNNKCTLIAEGANMPCTEDAVKLILKSKIAYGPGKAANAGGVAVSGLEIAQNRVGEYWTKEKVDIKLKKIMQDIFKTCVRYGKEETGEINYLKGANIGGFVKVAKAIRAQGVV